MICRETLINNCPVCGEDLGKYDSMHDIIHMTLCFDEGTGNQIMTGGFLTEKQASYGWMFKLSEWAHFSSYDVGLRSGSSSSYILVLDRKTEACGRNKHIYYLEMKSTYLCFKMLIKL